jgi:hypothetical protein
MSMYDDYRPKSGWGKGKPAIINDEDRDGFVQNDEGWYHAQRRSRLSRKAFVRAHRAEIDRAMGKGEQT